MPTLVPIPFCSYSLVTPSTSIPLFGRLLLPFPVLKADHVTRGAPSHVTPCTTAFIQRNYSQTSPR